MGELFDDLSVATPDSAAQVADPTPYFLGSIVLIKSGGSPNADVVDGRQRLTTFTILLAALRATFEDPAHRAELTGHLYEAGKPLAGIETRYRIQLRERDDAFFRQRRPEVADRGMLVLVAAHRLGDPDRVLGELVVEALRFVCLLDGEPRFPDRGVEALEILGMLQDGL